MVYGCVRHPSVSGTCDVLVKVETGNESLDPFALLPPLRGCGSPSRGLIYCPRLDPEIRVVVQYQVSEAVSPVVLEVPDWKDIGVLRTRSGPTSKGPPVVREVV